MPRGRAPSVNEGRAHSPGDGPVMLTPGRGERVAQVPPVTRVAQGAVPHADAPSLEPVRAFDQTLIGLYGQTELSRDRFCGLPGPLEWAGPQPDHVVPSQ